MAVAVVRITILFLSRHLLFKTRHLDPEILNILCVHQDCVVDNLHLLFLTIN